MTDADPARSQHSTENRAFFSHSARRISPLAAYWLVGAAIVASRLSIFTGETTRPGLTMNDWDDFEDVMLDGQAPVKVKDSWSCWMKNYLSGCTTCPPCPDADPFD